MPHAFPTDLVPLLRCAHDGGTFSVMPGAEGPPWGIVDGTLRCGACGSEVRIEGAIARMLDSKLTGEDELERAIRDGQFAAEAAARSPAPPSLADRLEIPPTMRAIAPRGRTVLEIGSGDGRLTVPMAAMGARVLAVDFSINSLRALATRLASEPMADPGPGRRIGIVNADVNRLRVASRVFDRALSTTPLDAREQRMALYAMVADALVDGGRYVASVEHDSLARRLLGLPLLRRYPNGILLEHFTRDRMRREATPYFESLRFSTMRPRIPFQSRLATPVVLAVSKLVVALPPLAGLGELLLMRAERPIRGPVEGERRRGSVLAQRCFRSYARMLGKDPLWERNERV